MTEQGSTQAWACVSGQPELPTEVLTKIFSLSRRNTLRNIVLCSRQFHVLASSFLYSDIFVRYGRDALKDDSTSNRLRQLVLYLLQNPSFASAVHHVRLRGPSQYDYATVPSIANKASLFTDTELEIAVRKHISHPENVSTNLARNRLSLRRTMFDSNTTLLTQLLLSLLPRAASLHIEIADGRLFENLALDSNVFHNLQAMTLEWKPAQNETPIWRPSRSTYPLFSPGDHLKDIMSIPSLNKLCIIGFTLGPREIIGSSFASLQPKSSSIRHIEFRRSLLHSTDSELLFEAFNSLETFIDVAPANHCQHPMLGPALSHLSSFHHSTLKCLWLDHRMTLGIPGVRVRSVDISKLILDFLGNFANLQNLSIPMDVLFNFDHRRAGWSLSDIALDCFPSSLRTMVLFIGGSTPDVSVTKAVQDFFRALQCRFSNATSSLGNLHNLKRVVLAATASLFLNLSLQSLVHIEQMQGLKFMFIALNCHDTWGQYIKEDSILACRRPFNDQDQILDEVCSNEIEELMGIFGMKELCESRTWHVLDKTLLRGRCRQLEQGSDVDWDMLPD